MLPVLTIVDDFLPGARCEEIRLEILSKGFNTEMVKECADRPPVPYENVNVRWMPEDFLKGLPQVFGQSVQMLQQAFRLGFKESQLHNLVHADHCCAQLAAVYYLNPLQQCRGGTAFWRHKPTGWEMMPTQEQMEEKAYDLEWMKDDWHHADMWEMVSLAGMKPNRLITYPTNAFHSRWPWEGFGDPSKPEEARLIWCGFFDLV